MAKAAENWASAISHCAEFYSKGKQRRRSDPDFSWELVDGSPLSPLRIVRRAINLLGFKSAQRREWLTSNSELLWGARSLLSDELSKLLFDQAIIVRMAGHEKFFFPRVSFDDLIETESEEAFLSDSFPRDYLGLPLKIFNTRLNIGQQQTRLRMVVNREFFAMLNSYRQYLMRRDNIDLTPVAGDVVLDCGSCIGDMSLVFAALVGPLGEVHTFDPIPVHARLCRHQASLNPMLAQVLYINELAVGSCTRSIAKRKVDSERIDPGAKATDDFSITTLDDYAAAHLTKVDFIKMDIEGAELDALAGAEGIIREFKPRLAISAYHRPDDFWLIPERLKTMNPEYQLYFGHHSPVQWESVFYAA